MTFVKLAVIHISVLYIFLPVGNTCGPTEFRSSQGECCPKCNIGSVIYRDCSREFNTTCIPCSPGTFMNEPNGLYKCFRCRKCNETQGIYIQSQCNTMKDTICDVLEGYHCTNYSNSQCLLGQKHSLCKPGQETKAPGTKFSDTVCEDCPYGFYSPSGLKCIRWTDCAAKDKVQTEDGSSVKDVTCTPSRYCIQQQF